MFEPFLGEDSYAYSHTNESEDDHTSQNVLAQKLDKGKGKMEDMMPQVPANSKNKPIPFKEHPKKFLKPTYKSPTQLKQPH